jgi:two-component system, OmpR family, sensor histidine kinase CssS
MKDVKLTTQLNLMFTFVTLLTSLIFLVAMNRLFREVRVDQNQAQLQGYLQEVRSNMANPTTSVFNGYIIYKDGVVDKIYNFDILNNQYTPTKLVNDLNIWPGTMKVDTINGVTYTFFIDRLTGGDIVIVFTSEEYIRMLGNSFNAVIQLSFIALVVLGNLIILMWSSITVQRVKRLKTQVAKLTPNNYKVPIELDGNDEITDLAKTIEKMRQEIEQSEKSKQEMLQNISHDFKTPIAVIQSYAEAIRDGITDQSEATIIVKQSEMLNQKVKQLLELSKLEYLNSDQSYEMINIKDIIINIVNNQKYRTNTQFSLELDDSKYFGIKENFYTAFSNIIDNAVRYAKTKIIIKLKNKKLTFYNDGEPINQKFIDELFKPYQKGQKGQFGLGMSIAQKTCAHFNLLLKVENVDSGVLFTIEPL